MGYSALPALVQARVVAGARAGVGGVEVMEQGRKRRKVRAGLLSLDPFAL